MRVLLVGSGGREHALATCLARSPGLTALYAAPGNPGMASVATLVPLKADDVAGLVRFAQEQKIDLIVPGPEAPLVAGLADACAEAGIPCAGPTKAAALLEGSKAFTKDVADAAGIPTARWERFDEEAPAIEFVRRRGAPIVIKADGLAGGKGVVVAQSVEEAEDAIRRLGMPLVIEECLVGEEVSLFAFCSDDKAVLIGAARDHKRLGDGDTGPNTGGMGAISPPPAFGREMQEKALDIMVRPMLAEMVRRGTPFRGVIFAGLMLTTEGPKLIEYNVRFGDPEAQALLIRLKSDLLPILAALAQGSLEHAAAEFSDEHSISLVLAANGYPDAPKKGGRISGIERAEAVPGVSVFHAGTKLADSVLVADGGRVLTVCAKAATPEEARKLAYEGASAIQWEDKIFRNDVGL
ncbi:phosphoribosylamine--glycine ligase [Gluconobacter roseus]|uniref:Phosphoribosylamine--glycine ligase n=1 Tax=Gluconobacter roseus NBRC 3990 TaxID=1307950 RepID=A0A4Y3M6E1_9PROT|nr:phosphoribosylamine--glycine ligase [Gluconobacter roseus]KXV44097.1 phosphoribosylamine--glycine ligase [Gluconobacter roseus]GBR45116.1 phosphoribosylamine--glycine ligase [Gluconobacter roseus NBRC 3990]GEB02851.1 phosphoribosylamine--glycine ligase [Gluconobacter roseus NBRC 3990]GLP93310.1 phosphoribosylamine--glycine ligase [Gluconobacter roseus NBRC 3990]